MISRSTPRPGKTQALNSDGETFDLRHLYAYGKSVSKQWRMGPTILLIKNKTGPEGKNTQCLSVTARNVKDATAGYSEATAWLVRTLMRSFTADRHYPSEIVQALNSIFYRLAANNHVVILDKAFLQDLKVLINPPIDLALPARVVLRELALPGAADQIKDGADVQTIAGVIRSLDGVTQERFKYQLGQRWGREASAKQLLAALHPKAQTATSKAPAKQGRDAVPGPMEQAQEPELTLGQLPYNRRNSTGSMHFIEVPDRTAETPQASAPLGQSFINRFGAHLQVPAIERWVTIAPNTTVQELAAAIEWLPDDQLATFKNELQEAAKGSYTDELSVTARQLLAALNGPLAEVQSSVHPLGTDAPQPELASSDEPHHAPKAAFDLSMKPGLFFAEIWGGLLEKLLVKNPPEFGGHSTVSDFIWHMRSLSEETQATISEKLISRAQKKESDIGATAAQLLAAWQWSRTVVLPASTPVDTHQVDVLNVDTPESSLAPQSQLLHGLSATFDPLRKLGSDFERVWRNILSLDPQVRTMPDFDHDTTVSEVAQYIRTLRKETQTSLTQRFRSAGGYIQSEIEITATQLFLALTQQESSVPH